MVNIYVLRLNNNKYYIGKTKKITYRLTDHFNEGGSSWTKMYKPISLNELRPNCSDSDEQVVTQEYMKKYGIDNVRGGPWCKIKLSVEEKRMITHIINSGSDKCYNCGQKGHFSINCKKKKCSRCGRDNHKTENCYAKTTLDGEMLEYLSTDEEFIWECLICYKEFDSEKGLNYHQKYCNKKTPNCKRCGRKGHYSNDCFASTHIKGYELWY